MPGKVPDQTPLGPCMSCRLHLTKDRRRTDNRRNEKRRKAKQ